MRKTKTYPKQDLIDDFVAWYDDLDETNGQDHVQTIPDIIWQFLPHFCQKWTVKDLCSVIRDQCE